MSKVETIGEIIRRLRKEKGEPLRKVAAYLDVDQAVLSKIERGQRKATKGQVEKLARYFGADEKEMLVAWLSDRILYEIKDHDIGQEALKAAEAHIQYMTTPKTTHAQIKEAVREELAKYPSVTRAWLFGSFARNENNYKSDIDIMVDVPEKEHFSLFDLFQIQHDLELAISRKVDVVIKSELKPFAWETAKEDLKLIYERSKG